MKFPEKKLFYSLALCPNEEWTEWAVTSYECDKGQRRVETRQLITRVLVNNDVTVQVLRSVDTHPNDPSVRRVFPGEYFFCSLDRFSRASIIL